MPPSRPALTGGRAAGGRLWGGTGASPGCEAGGGSMRVEAGGAGRGGGARGWKAAGRATAAFASGAERRGAPRPPAPACGNSVVVVAGFGEV